MSGPTPLEAAILSGMLTGKVEGPLHLAERISLGHERLREWCTAVDSLRERGLIQAPADTDTELWTVTRSGREYLGSCESDFIRTVVGGLV